MVTYPALSLQCALVELGHAARLSDRVQLIAGQDRVHIVIVVRHTDVAKEIAEIPVSPTRKCTGIASNTSRF